MSTVSNNAAEPAADPLVAEALDNALDAMGTAYIFERRARRFRRWLQLLAFLGLVVPS